MIEFLNYVEKTNELQGEAFQSERVTKIQRAVQQIKSNEQIGVKYMQEWEERQDEIDKARKAGREEGLVAGREEGREEGLTAGREEKTIELIQKKLSKGKDFAQIADELEMTEEEAKSIWEKQKAMEES